MRPRRVRHLLLAALLIVGGCGNGGGDGARGPAAVPFTKIDLPAGAAPVVLSPSGDTLLVGVRRNGQPVVPGLLRRGPDGVITDVAARGVSPYGALARWYSIASDGDRILAIGGERGGAHGNVRWSVWTGTGAGISEKPQGFSTFGGYGAGELTDAVLTPAGPALVGTWQSAKAAFDVAVWTADGDGWARHGSAGTALESTPDAIGFPIAATALGQGVLVAGWRLAGGQRPVVWRSESGVTGWTSAPLPEAGRVGSALAARCWGEVCGVAGRVDGTLAVWRLAGGGWVRLAGIPPIAVGDRDRLTAPIEVGGRLAQLVSDGGQVKIAWADGERWTVRAVAGPHGTVTAATRVGNAIYLLAGADEGGQTLWWADVGALR